MSSYPEHYCEEAHMLTATNKEDMMKPFNWEDVKKKKENIPMLEFNDLLRERLEAIENVLASKQDEYASDGNRLHNFDKAAEVIGTTPERALRGMWMKHLVSVLDIIESPTSKNISKIHVDEKIGDTINYLILLEYMLERRRTDEEAIKALD